MRWIVLYHPNWWKGEVAANFTPGDLSSATGDFVRSHWYQLSNKANRKRSDLTIKTGDLTLNYKNMFWSKTLDLNIKQLNLPRNPVDLRPKRVDSTIKTLDLTNRIGIQLAKLVINTSGQTTRTHKPLIEPAKLRIWLSEPVKVVI